MTAQQNAAVETNENTNVENLNTEQSSETVNANSEQEIVKAVLSDTNASIKSFVDLAEAKLFDGNLVAMIRQISRDVAVEVAPVNHDVQIGKLQKEMLDTQDPTKRMGILMEMQDLLNEQLNQGNNIREKLEGVSFAEIAVAYSKEIVALVDSVLVDTLKHHSTDSLKSKRGSRGTGAATTPAETGPAEHITFEYKGATYVLKAGKGRLTADLLTIAEDHAKAVKNEDAKKKAPFMAALKDGKVKGAKVTKVETI